MPVYWATSYFLKPEKAKEYQKWLASEEAKNVFKAIEGETGFKYLNTYFPILGLGEYDAEDWMVAPDWASADKIRCSKAFNDWGMKTWNLLDQTRGFRSRVLRTATDVQMMEPPKE
jgi:hypothetical protein